MQASKKKTPPNRRGGGRVQRSRPATRGTRETRATRARLQGGTLKSSVDRRLQSSTANLALALAGIAQVRQCPAERHYREVGSFAPLLVAPMKFGGGGPCPRCEAGHDESIDLFVSADEERGCAMDQCCAFPDVAATARTDEIAFVVRTTSRDGYEMVDYELCFCRRYSAVNTTKVTSTQHAKPLAEADVLPSRVAGWRTNPQPAFLLDDHRFTLQGLRVAGSPGKQHARARVMGYLTKTCQTRNPYKKTDTILIRFGGLNGLRVLGSTRNPPVTQGLNPTPLFPFS